MCRCGLRATMTTKMLPPLGEPHQSALATGRRRWWKPYSGEAVPWWVFILIAAVPVCGAILITIRFMGGPVALMLIGFAVGVFLSGFASGLGYARQCETVPRLFRRIESEHIGHRQGTADE